MPGSMGILPIAGFFRTPGRDPAFAEGRGGLAARATFALPRPASTVAPPERF